MLGDRIRQAVSGAPPMSSSLSLGLPASSFMKTNDGQIVVAAAAVRQGGHMLSEGAKNSSMLRRHGHGGGKPIMNGSIPPTIATLLDKKRSQNQRDLQPRGHSQALTASVRAMYVPHIHKSPLKISVFVQSTTQAENYPSLAKNRRAQNSQE